MSSGTQGITFTVWKVGVLWKVRSARWQKKRSSPRPRAGPSLNTSRHRRKYLQSSQAFPGERSSTWVEHREERCTERRGAAPHVGIAPRSLLPSPAAVRREALPANEGEQSGTCLPCSSDEAHGHARRAPRSPGTCTPSLQLPPHLPVPDSRRATGTQRPADSGAGTLRCSVSPWRHSPALSPRTRQGLRGGRRVGGKRLQPCGRRGQRSEAQRADGSEDRCAVPGNALRQQNPGLSSPRQNGNWEEVVREPDCGNRSTARLYASSSQRAPHRHTTHFKIKQEWKGLFYLFFIFLNVYF